MHGRNRAWLKVASLGLVLCAAATWLAAQSQEAQKKEKLQETYSANALVRAGGRSATTFVTLRIEAYSSDEEILQLAEILRSKGSDALLKAVSKLKPKGRLSPTGRTGTEIQVIRSRPLENGRRRVLMVTDRPITFAELRQGTRSRDYEFGIIQLELDEQGKGEGAMLAAAKIKFTDDNTIEFEHYGIDPVRLMNVYRMK